MEEPEEETIDLTGPEEVVEEAEYNQDFSDEDSLLPQAVVEGGEGHRRKQRSSSGPFVSWLSSRSQSDPSRPLRGTQRPLRRKLWLLTPKCSRDRCCFLSAFGLTIFIILVTSAAYMHSTFASSCPYGFLLDTSERVSVKKDPVTASGEIFPWDDVRLPSTLVPNSYHIHLHPNLTTFKFTGNVSINVTVAKKTDMVVFHVKELKVTQSSVKTLNNTVPIVKELEYTENEQYCLMLGQELEVGQNYIVEVHFSGELKDGLYGFYRSTYTLTNDDGVKEKRVLATTQFEAANARAAFPCFDEPALKATFQLHMVREGRHSTLFNMPKDHTDEYPGGLYMDVFQESVPMSTYLVCFIVSDFQSLQTSTDSDIAVAVHAPEDRIDQAHYALSVAKTVLQYYETFFGVKYPLPKMDLVAIPDFGAGAMENWGLVTYRETAILYNADESSASDKQWVAIVIAHEFAHQWFGNLVTMKWWNDLWLNEGFASFVEFIGTDKVSPEWKMLDQFVVTDLQTALAADSLSNSHPISVTVGRPEEVEEIFDSISYDKGASILRMLESFLGRETFLQGLTSYLQEHQFGNAATDDLWKALDQAARTAGKADMNIKRVMDTWTNQMGYPVVKVTRQNSKLVLEQERFLLMPPSPACGGVVEFTSPYRYEWIIPLTYVTSAFPKGQQTLFLDTRHTTISLDNNSPEWVKFNTNQTGFYRVNYDPDNWDALIGLLQENHEALNSADRAGLLDDAFFLVRAGLLGLEKSMELVKYVKKERDYVPIATALGGLGYIAKLLETENDEDLYNNMKLFILELLEETIGEVGWEDQGDQLTKFLRSTVLGAACKYGHQQSTQQAQALFNSWMHSRKKVSPNLKTVVYTSGVQHGGKAEWDFCWQQYTSATVAAEKRKLLYALANSRDPDLVKKLLRYTLDSTKIRSQDTVRTITYVSQTAVGYKLAWEFVKSNWQTFLDRYGSGSFNMAELAKIPSHRFSTGRQLKEVKAFFQSHDISAAARAARQTMETIQTNIFWLEKNKRKVKTWIKNHFMPPEGGKARSSEI
ncbi:endoplasmic reticulum aminopeptidase 1-like isoform X1 [Branchiostoma floridae]|uniref:Endoplasmic reticulum aminopeptidase 1-like isoform X1 n=2 Tax=Branchiostoma floridae TaxID=7739 RepID=A0A9J7KRA6_BRAFL|nr:endoplasmic reticulum aminopeptidase 1-like isoform X1 [Branchiostoma floridae]